MTCLVVGDLIGGKVTSVHLFGREWPFSSGQLAFPITFILTDIVNEFYGRKVARRVTVLAFCMVGLTVTIIAIATQLPWASFTSEPWWVEDGGVTPPVFSVVFSQAMWIQIASMVAFLIGNFVDIGVFFVIKKATGNRLLWLRSTGSTAVSQLIDTLVISSMVFAPKMFPDQFFAYVVTSYLIKLVVAILVTPIIYGLHGFIERVFHIEPAPPEVESADIAG
jgi:uncharacterized integral membrane protein (TIGR00697 family)